MSKLKRIVLPLIVVMIVAVMSMTVLAAGSATVGFKVFDKNGEVTNSYTGTSVSGIDLSSVDGLEEAIKKYNVNLSDFKLRQGVNIKGTAGTPKFRVVLTAYKPGKDEICIMLHQTGTNSFQKKVFKGTGNYAEMTGLDNLSPFYLYTATAKSSAQTGDFAPAYIAMISVALLSCGVIFAIRAKKATK